jgi:hypothetical protein
MEYRGSCRFNTAPADSITYGAEQHLSNPFVVLSVLMMDSASYIEWLRASLSPLILLALVKRDELQ